MKDLLTMICSLILLLSVVFVTLDNNRKNQEINSLKYKLNCLEQIHHNDSVQITEFRSALDTFFVINTPAAQQIISLIEQENIN